MSDFWRYWIENVSGTLSDYFIYAGIAFILFYFVLKNVLASRKIQKRFPKWTDYRRDLIYSLITMAIFASIAVYIFDAGFEYTNMYADISDRSIGYYIFSYVAMFFIHDTYFYWVHRLMHHPLLYRKVHMVHHKSTNPSPWTAYAFHPFEAVLEAGIMPLIAFTIPVHREALGFFLLFQFIYNVYGHLGYELWPKGFHKTWIGRYVNTSVAHNVHHKHFTGNYGLYTLIWDRLMSTISPHYDKTFEQTTERSTTSSKARPIHTINTK